MGDSTISRKEMRYVEKKIISGYYTWSNSAKIDTDPSAFSNLNSTNSYLFQFTSIYLRF